jgi:hypothetical protein
MIGLGKLSSRTFTEEVAEGKRDYREHQLQVFNRFHTCFKEKYDEN